MKPGTAVVLMLVAVAAPALAGGDAAPPPTIAALVRNLAQLQDAAANGDPAAASLQPRLIAEISAKLGREDPLTLPDGAMLRAAIIYALSGGRPGDVDVLIRASPGNDPLHRLLEGAVHYANGRKPEALAAFRAFDPLRLPGSIGGRVALAEAALLPGDATAEKIRLLNIAARLMPGTLVEESALRRLHATAAAAGDPLQLQITAARYVERFAASLYAADFMEEHVKDAVALEGKGKAVDLPAFELLLNRLPRPRRVALYLLAARLAVPRGLADLAVFAASRARRLAAEGSSEWQAATLYDAASLIAGPGYETAIALLAAIDERRLPPPDAELLASVRRIAAALRRPAALSPLPPKDEQALAKAAPAAALIARANGALQAADALLAEPAP